MFCCHRNLTPCHSRLYYYHIALFYSELIPDSIILFNLKFRHDYETLRPKDGDSMYVQ